MNWIIRNTSKLKFHTNFKVLLIPIENEIKDLKWLVSDLEINTSEMEKLPINHEEDWFMISANEMNAIRDTETQIIWGVFSGIPNKQEIDTNQMELPFAEGNEQIWENGNLQAKNSIIEIIAWDSSYTIVKFTDDEMSDKFKKYFNEAIELDKYKWK